MARADRDQISLQQRVDAYLARFSDRPNSFVMAAEAAEAEADMNEYLLRRAEEELSETKSHLEEIKQQINELRQAR